MQTAVHHDGQLVGDPLWHVQPMELTVKYCRQTTVALPRVTDDTGGGINDSLQRISDRLRRPCIECIAVVDA